MWKISDVLFCLIIFIYRISVIESATYDVTRPIRATNVGSDKDICTLCNCQNENNFSTINCDLTDNKQYTFNNELKLPPKANRMEIRLGTTTKLYIGQKFFKGSKINQLTISGQKTNYQRNNHQEVEIGEYAFDGINAIFPEFLFTNINTLTLRDRAFTLSDTRDHLEMNLFVENVWQVYVYEGAFRNTLFQTQFTNIGDLQINKDAFTGAYVTDDNQASKLSINSSFVPVLRPLKATTLKELKIENCDIGTIESFALDMLLINSFILHNNKINQIESFALPEKLLFMNMAVTECDINIIETDAINGVGTTAFVFEKNRVNTIKENAIKFNGVDVSFSHNVITNMENSWFKCGQWSNLTVFNNSFGRFDSMLIEESQSPNKCLFQHNTFTEMMPNSFKNFNSLCQLKELIFFQVCSCNFVEWLGTIFDSSSKYLATLRAQSNCRVEDVLLHCFKTNIVKYEQYHKEICNKKSKLDCKKTKFDKINGTFVDPNVLNDDDEWLNYIHYIIGAAAAALILCTICLFSMLKRKSNDHDDDSTMNETYNPQTDLLTLNIADAPPSYQASMRSMKSFSNKDHRIIKQTLEKMKQNQPQEKCDLVQTSTNRLLNEHLNEFEKVKIIGDIVQVIGECENSGEDFVAFTDILYKHLAPDNTEPVRNATLQQQQQNQHHQEPMEVLYAEPGLPHNTPIQTARQQTKPANEHIYAEPANLMQQQTMMPLLLANNYSNPLDNNSNNNNLYSEPVLNTALDAAFKPSIAIPYAVSQDIQLPSTSKNLPDILSRMEPGPSGELSRINRSPNTHRKIPEYTVPSLLNKQPTRVTRDNIEDWSDESMENSTSSNHSGGSNATVKIDELIQYADNEA